MKLVNRFMLAVVLSLMALALFAGLLANASEPTDVYAPSRVAEQQDGCQFAHITVTADLVPGWAISDTAPFAAVGRTIYFPGAVAGREITVSAELTRSEGVATCYAWFGPALGRSAEFSVTLHAGVAPITATLAYPAPEALTTTLVMTASHVAGRPAVGDYQQVSLDLRPDDQAPVVESVILANGQGYTNTTAITVSVAGSDAGSGPRQMVLWDAPGAASITRTYAPTTSWTLVGDDGQKTVHVRLIDFVGNVGEAISDTIILDRQPPTVTVTAPARAISATHVSITWQAEDNGSGLAAGFRVAYAKDGGDPVVLDEADDQDYTAQIPVDPNGVYRFTVAARDRAGNEAVGTAVTAVIERARLWLPLVMRNYPPRPTGSVRIAGDAATVFARPVTLTLTSNVAGGDTVVRVRLSNDGQAWTDWEPYRTTRPGWPLADGISGPRAVYAQFQGALGGVSSPVSDTVYLLLDGDFEAANWGAWDAAGEMNHTLVAAPETQGHQAALLGDPAYNNRGGVATGNARIAQTLRVPSDGNPVLTLRYRVYTHDTIWTAAESKYFDSFEVYLGPVDWGQANRPASGDPRRRALCQDHPGTPDITVQLGLVLCDGNPGAATRTQPPWDSGWRTVILDLSPFKGQEIVLSLANFNRWDTWYNTWTYVDEVTFTP